MSPIDRFLADNVFVKVTRMVAARLPHPDPALKHALYRSEMKKLRDVLKHQNYLYPRIP